MGKVEHTIEIAASPQAVFDYVADYRHTIDYMQGLERWEPVTDKTHGLGARFDTALRLGPKTFESVLEIDRWEPGELLGWDTVSGFRQSGTQILDAAGDGTRTTFVFAYTLPGGMAGRLLGKTTEPILQSTVRESMEALKAQIEALG